MSGIVSFVGSGPGDPELLTLLYRRSASVTPSRVPARTRDGVVRDV